jgi:protein YIPF6
MSASAASAAALPNVQGTIGSAPVAAVLTAPSASASASASGAPSTSASTSSEAPPLPFDTLDEPVLDTVMRDVRQVGTKLRYVLLPTLPPSDAVRELRNWDLWGPLLLCLALAVLLSAGAAEGQAGSVFALVFVLVWAGAGIVTLNAQLLGGRISFFQSVCVLGYCMCPLVLAGALCALSRNGLWRSVVAGVGVAWACRASVVFMRELVPAPRRALAVYPVVLFYLMVAWMVWTL